MAAPEIASAAMRGLLPFHCLGIMAPVRLQELHRHRADAVLCSGLGCILALAAENVVYDRVLKFLGVVRHLFPVLLCTERHCDI